MFKKPVKIKSNNLAKGSERKTIKDLFCKSFPKATEQEVNSLLNNKKEPLNCIKLVTHDNEVLQVYLIQKQPIFFSLRDKIFPTVFLLWKLPHLIPNFTTHPQVMSFINSGADLMLPGVLTPPGLPRYNNVLEGTPVYVNLSDNKAAVAVGMAAQSSFEMERAGGKGKCVKILHFYGDYLYNIDGNSISLPNFGPPDWLTLKDYVDDFPALGGVKVKLNEVKPSLVEPEPLKELQEVIEEISIEDNDDDVDELLHYCFLASIKYSKTLTLPLLISNFFKLQMLPMCPEGSNLDLKKTSYKKLKPFLDEMSKTGLITVTEIKKGVEAITNINKNHPKYCEFYLKPDLRPKKDSDNNQQTIITESYVITATVLPIFQPAGYRKGDTIEGPNIRKHFTDYIKQNNSQSPDNNKLIHPNTELLQTICKTQNPITWEEAFEKTFESMKSCFKVKSTQQQEQILNKGKVQPISMTVKVRSGNKKVTLIDNLEVFGVNINEFAKECQHGVAASTSITPAPPGKKSDQLLVQGNQVVFVHDLLVEKYKIPKRYIRGLELAPKKKK
ncbi:unnamed protein product [Ceutorhynchus assimilis]|uniref:SUI1 domain-containing protein n=1 Tax=Ceutorhynchus assimilis TaxID=467358 RepID=A0A9N9MV70_9CUCU|nr:unnamed protein product [Ceutorhynchus assimilis]